MAKENLEDSWEVDEIPEEDVKNYHRVVCEKCGAEFSLFAGDVCPECGAKVE